MFEIKIDDAKYWRNCVEAINSLIDEGSFSITKEGISLKAMDPSGISMVSFSIPNKAFSKYNVDKSTSVGLNLDNLNKILSSARANERLTMKEAENKIVLEFAGENSKRRYKLPIIDVRHDSNKEPNIDFDSLVEVQGDSFKEILKDANLLSSYVGLKADKGTFMVIAKGELGELEEEHLDTAEFIKKLSVSKGAYATFNLEYLSKMVGACPSNSAITISMKTEEPVKLDYNIGEAHVSYFLAPYMES
ncbi:MAG: proliferating cell nuclear antigen (pcna) [Candidatus Micrarchaeaceae archaeon]